MSPALAFPSTKSLGPYVMTEDRGPVAMFYNPAPNIPGGQPTQIGGINYPYGTRGVQVSSGRTWVAEPEGWLHRSRSAEHGVPLNDPDASLILESIATHLLPWGVWRLDPNRAREMGVEAYFAEMTAAGQNRLCEIIKTDTIDRLDKENEDRIRRELKPRKFDGAEEVLVFLREKMMVALHKKGELKIEEQKAAIEEAVAKAAEKTFDPSQLPWNELRTWAKEQGVDVFHATRESVIEQLKKMGKIARGPEDEVREAIG